MGDRPAAFVIKAAIADPGAAAFTFTAAKTMYGGKHIAAGDPVFVFASETDGGQGLIVRGVVTFAEAVARTAGQGTPRVTLTVEHTAPAARPMGRRELKPFRTWDDGQPETELNSKFYRQATNKLAGISAQAAAFLVGCF